MLFISIILFLLFIGDLSCQDQDQKGPYKGSFIGKLNTYHHQVSGDVYAVDQYTLLLVNFNYDGNGGDTFFWAGDTNRPGPQGFIVPDQFGKTNILERYHNQEFTLTLPDSKEVSRIKWLAVYDIATQNTFADIFIPETFESPAPQKGGSLIGKSRGVGSGVITFKDAKTIVMSEFSYDGTGEEVYFWMGVGAQPSAKGEKIPDEYGYLDPIRAYKREDVTLEIPGVKTIFDIDWISVYDVAAQENLGSVLVPDGLNVPPSLVSVQEHTSSLPNCVQVHKDMQVAWELFGDNQITVELAAQIDEDDYMAFGISGSTEKTQMLGADVAVAYVDGFRGFATDYNITALAPCVQVLGQFKGVCRDDKVGLIDNNQVFGSTQKNGVTTVTYRRTIIPDTGDLQFIVDKASYFVWAMGKLDHNKEPTFHDVYPKGDVYIQLKTKEPVNTCFPFSKSDSRLRPPWEKSEIFDGTLRSFTASIGPAGGRRGYSGITGQPTNGLAWYINGLLAPELWLRRGLTYSFKVYGGNNPHSAEWYHPFIITVEPHGGFDQLSDAAQRQIRVLGGVEFTRRGRPRPTAVGALCYAKHSNNIDRRLDDDFQTFRKFNRSLESVCEDGAPGVLVITPNTTWPDTVYYNSFSHSNMGWKIHVVDRYRRSNAASKVSVSYIYYATLATVLVNFMQL